MRKEIIDLKHYSASLQSMLKELKPNSTTNYQRHSHSTQPRMQSAKPLRNNEAKIHLTEENKRLNNEANQAKDYNDTLAQMV